MPGLNGVMAARPNDYVLAASFVINRPGHAELRKVSVAPADQSAHEIPVPNGKAGTANAAAPGLTRHQVSAARWIASRKLPNRRRIVFSDGRMAASVQLSAVGSEPCSATNLRSDGLRDSGIGHVGQWDRLTVEYAGWVRIFGPPGFVMARTDWGQIGTKVFQPGWARAQPYRY